MQLENKLIVITGGTSGIGRAMVDHLAGTNQVVVVARNADRLQELKSIYPQVATYQCNLARPGEVESTADRIAKDHPRVDVLINNAAVQHTPTFLDDDFRFETITEEINTNFVAVCSLIYLLLPAMLMHNHRAAILNVNSALGLAPKKSSAVYCATKGALNILSWSLRYQLAPTNIRVLQAMLPLVDTSMTAGRGHGKIASAVAAAALIHGIEREVEENFVGKAKLLQFVYNMSPALARRILKKF